MVKTKPILEPKTPTAVSPKVPTTHYAAWMTLVVVMILGFIAGSVISQKGGWLFGEADWFLIDHNSDRPFFSKIFAPHSHDAGQYQARELNHVLEFLDAHFIYWCVRHKMPHFYSIVNFVALFIISVAFWHNVTKYLKMDPLAAVLLLAVFWTAPCIFFSGVYMRCAKQGTAFLSFFLIWFLIKRIAFSKPSVASGPGIAPSLSTGSKVLLWIQTFLLGLAMCWIDRQGFYLTGAIVLSLLLFTFGPRISNQALFVTALGVAMVVHTIYNLKIGPVVVPRLTGFPVSLQFQKLPLDVLFQHLFTYLWRGTVLFLNNVGYFFANMSAGLTLFFVAALLWLYSKVRVQFTLAPKGKVSFQFKSFFGILLLVWIGLLIALNTLMVLREQGLAWPDVRVDYYWIPTTVLILIAVGFAVHLFTQQFAVPAWVPRLILAAAFISNLTCLQEHYQISRSGHRRGYMAGSVYLLKAIKELYEAPPGPVPLAKQYDTEKSKYYEDFTHVVKNVLEYPNLTADEFVNSSNFYNWLRSKRNLDFKQW